MPDVVLECIRVGSRLRVRIISTGYNNDANCQFPRDIRVEGRKYSVPDDTIKFGPTNGKFFYRILNKKQIKILEEGEEVNNEVILEKIYDNDETDKDCIICFAMEKDTVFVPCGHYCCCKTCAVKLDGRKCCICRGKIEVFVDKEQVQLA